MMSKLTSINPSNNQIIGEVEITSEEELIQIVGLAKNALKEWIEMGLKKRVALLRKVVKAIEDNKEKLAILQTQEMGMPIKDSRREIDEGMRFFNWYLDNAYKYLSPEIIYKDDKITHTVYYEPIGTAAVIVPWNYPLSNFVWGCGQNLVSGNTVIFKHSEECPLFGKALDEIITGIGLPEGVFNQVYGDGWVGDLLVHQDINLISFTGSTRVGKLLYKIAGEKFIKAVCEMGGSAPGIIFADANLDQSLDTIYFNRFYNCGQSCDALKRLIVHESRVEEVVSKLKKLLSDKKIGDPQDESTDIGPLVALRQLELLESQVKDAIEKGAKVEIGGKRPGGLTGAFYEPTLIYGITQEMRVWKEEVFGPVLSIVTFKEDTEAIKLANDTAYGLGAYVFTEDKEKAQKVASLLESGMISVNNASYLQPCSPFGGYKSSGMGREHGKFGFQELTQVKVVATEN
jgi:acyl-CoA reductase-like NAD-dependent aldehyde dehydrogenase